MTDIPDSGNPDNVFDGLGFEKPDDRITQLTWQHLWQNYRISATPLGKGGQAVVFAAEEIEAPHRRVAIKVYLGQTAAARRAFNNEALILSSDRLPPEVVGYFQCASKSGIQAYLVLEFIDGQPLAKLATAKRRLSLDQQLDLAKRLARAVHRLHQSNLVFGDLSANNVLVEDDGSGDIRFVDLAGAKELIKGHGRLRTSVNMITRGFIPQTQAESAVGSGLMSAARTNLGTDIYAVAANLFFLLTGKIEAECRQQISSRDAAPHWDAALRQAGVPRGIRRIALKGLRVVDDRTGIDPRGYVSAEAVADDLAAWQARRLALKFRIPAMICVGVLAVVALVGWQKYEAERAAHTVRVWEDLCQQVDALPNASAPGVAALIVRGRMTLPADVPVTTQDVQTRIDTLRRALVVSKDLEWAESLRESLGDVLNQSPWLTTCKAIVDRKDELAREFLSLKDDVEVGHTDGLQPRLARLHQQLAELAQENTRAAPAEQARMNYNRLETSVSERLRNKDVFIEISRQATQARQQLDVGDWNEARLQFAASEQRLTEWLEVNETTEENLARREATVTHLAQVELENRDLESRLSAAIKESDRTTVEVIKLPRYTNSIGMEFVLLPRGRYTMGSPVPRQQDDEAEHEVEVKRPFWIAITEVTEQCYSTIDTSTPTSFRSSRLPVANVSYFDALKWCNLLSAAEDLPAAYEFNDLQVDASGSIVSAHVRLVREPIGYRLPTEIEWEFAARGGTTTPRFCDGDDTELENYAWFASNSPDKRRHIVANKSPNPFGLFDVYGNVWEHAVDEYVRDPKTRVDEPTPAATDGLNVIRGASFMDPGDNTRSAYRNGIDANSRSPTIGFRVSRTATQHEPADPGAQDDH